MFSNIDDIRIELAGSNFIKFLEKGIISFPQFVDMMKERERLSSFLIYSDFYKVLYEKHLLTTKDVEYLLCNLQHSLKDLSFFVKYHAFDFFLESKLLDFRKVVDRYAEISNADVSDSNSLYFLINWIDADRKFDSLIVSQVISQEDLQYLIEKLTFRNWSSFNSRYNLLNYCFENFIFKSEVIQKFDEFLICLQDDIPHLKSYSTFLDYAEIGECFVNRTQSDKDRYSNNVRLYRSLFELDLTSQQRNDIFDVLRRSKQSREILTQLSENNLLTQYDFESLKRVLTKDDSKTLKTKFNL